MEVLQIRLLDPGSEQFQLKDGDLIVVEGLAQDIKDLVFIEGEVDHPRAYSLKEVPRALGLTRKGKTKGHR